MKQEALVFDTFTVGQKLSAFICTVSAQDIDEFCQTWDEDNPIYLDDEAAKRVGFEGRVAPPMMVRVYAHLQNVLSTLNRTVPAHTIHARGEYMFITPVKPGDTITTTGKVTEKYIERGRKYISFDFTSVNQRGETVVVNRHTSVWPA